MTDTEFAKSVNDLLDKLPNTAAGIAQFFRDNSIKGQKGSLCFCPIANYINKSCVTDGSLYLCQVLGSYAIGRGPGLAGKLRWINFNNEAVRAFVNEFDDGKYPELIEER